MKKILTLVLALGTMSAVFAQGGYQRQDSRDVVLGRPTNTTNDSRYSRPYDNRYDNTVLSSKERDKQIKQINKDYDKQIEAVKRSRSMRSYEKDRQIRMLIAERDRRINELNYRYNNNSGYNNRNDDRYNRRW